MEADFGSIIEHFNSKVIPSNHSSKNITKEFKFKYLLVASATYVHVRPYLSASWFGLCPLGDRPVFKAAGVL